MGGGGVNHGGGAVHQGSGLHSCRVGQTEKGDVGGVDGLLPRLGVPAKIFRDPDQLQIRSTLQALGNAQPGSPGTAVNE